MFEFPIKEFFKQPRSLLGAGAYENAGPEAAAMGLKTIWITPEPKWGWSLGSCDMPTYEPLCDRVEVVRSADQLAGVAEELVRARL
jgi:hypothetical protein